VNLIVLAAKTALTNDVVSRKEDRANGNCCSKRLPDSVHFTASLCFKRSLDTVDFSLLS